VKLISVDQTVNSMVGLIIKRKKLLRLKGRLVKIKTTVTLGLPLGVMGDKNFWME